MMRIVLLALAVCQIALAVPQPGSVFYDSTSQKYSFRRILDKNSVAYGTFDDALNTTGWGLLTIRTNRAFPDDVAMFAAGYLEGALTQQRIYESSLNMNYQFFRGNPAPAKLGPWLEAQDQWTKNQIKANPNSEFWQGVNFIIQQFEGSIQGYADNAPASQQRSRLDFQVLNGVGDLLDLLNVLRAPEDRPDWSKMSDAEFEERIFRSGMCSAIVKVTPDFGELFAAHSSWFSYSAMNRIYKNYFLDLKAPFVAARKMGFSSYPGFLESLDDFYVMDSGLAMVQTTNNVFNRTLYDLVTPQSLLAWHRVRLANMLAKSGPDWYNIVKQYNSGTYNNQYMVVDYKLFRPGQPLLPNTLFVCEQIPGLVYGEDTTPVLKLGYFPSYNIPYFELIFNLSGYPDIVKQRGPDSSYQLAPRAKIFRRDQNGVTDLASLKRLLRYNKFQDDPFSKGNPGNAICSRGDLRATPGLSGCYDSKVTSYALFRTLSAEAINGPTYQDQPVFSWKPEFTAAHYGQPTTFNFPWLPITPNWEF